MGSKWSKLSKVVSTTCNLSLHPFSFLILLHQSSKMCNIMYSFKYSVLEYSRYDINGYHFWMVKLEASHPLAATTNSGLVANGEDAISHITDY
jgi:hypothetical protein